MPEHSTGVAGIDTAKAKLDVAVCGVDERLSVANDRRGWRGLAAWLARHGVGRVGIEASGGYERGVIDDLRRRGVEVCLLQPLQVRSFARLHRQRAKNDAIDAALIAACTAALPGDAKPIDPRIAPLADRLTFIEQIEDDLVRWKTRLEHITEPRLRRLAEAQVAACQTLRKAELARLSRDLRRHEDLGRRLDLVLSIPGIGERTALALLLRMPELGALSREAAASLAGLAPFDDDSGTHRGVRHIAGGRGRLRRSLYAAALPAAMFWNAPLKTLYRRLTAAGKAHRVALVACARKLLVYANTVLARGTPWTVRAAPG